MGPLSLFRRRTQAPNADAIPVNDLGQAGSQLTQALAGISAAGLVIASAGLGATFAFNSGKEHGLAMAGLMTTFAVALELAKPIAVSSAFSAFRSWAVVRGLALSLLAVVAIAYSLTAELTLIAGSRGDLTAKREASIEAHSDKREAVKAARAELATLAPSRTVEEAKADIAKLLVAYPKAGDCKNIAANTSARWVCPKVAVLTGEQARAKRRAELQAVIDKATSTTGGAAAVKSADPGSAALATYLAGIGLTVSPAKLADYLVLVPVVALELGAALSMLLVQSVSGGQRFPVPKDTSRLVTTPRARRESVDSRERAPAPETGRQRTPAVDAKSRPRRQSTRTASGLMSTRRLGPATVVTKSDAKTAIVSTLREHGGKLEGASVRGLASLIGATKSTTFNAIAGLIAAGTVVKLGGALVLQA